MISGLQGGVMQEDKHTGSAMGTAGGSDAGAGNGTVGDKGIG